MVAYYNEIEPYAVEWLRNLIAAGHIAPGDVDDRSIADVQPGDLAGYDQCHFFAGLGGWAYAARLAGWPDDRALWTGSCPCQPFSVAGAGRGFADERHLWPEWFRLIRACRPSPVFGEQVAAAVGKGWLDGVFSDLESAGYARRAFDLPACAVDAPHQRHRLWFVADADSAGLRHEPGRLGGQDGAGARIDRHAGEIALEHAKGERRGEGRPEHELWSGRNAAAGAGGRDVGNADQLGASEGREQRSGQFGGAGGDPRASAWAGAEWLVGADGKARRVKPGVRLLAHGIPARVAKLRALGNAIVPQEAAEIIGAYLDTTASGGLRSQRL